MNLLKGLPVLALSLLSACGDDNLTTDFTYPDTYDFRSMVSDSSSSISTEKSTALHFMIEEFQVFFQKAVDVEMTHLNQSRFEERLNRILEYGTLSGEDYANSLVARDLYATDDLPSPSTSLERSLNSSFELDIEDYSSLEKELALRTQIIGSSISARNLPNQVENESGINVGYFIGYPLLTDVPVEGEEATRDITNGNEMPRALIEAWIREIASLYDPVYPVSYVNSKGMHLNILIDEMLLGAVIYGQAVNFNLNRSLGLASQNSEPFNQTAYDLAVQKHEEALENIQTKLTALKRKEREVYSTKLDATEKTEALIEASERVNELDAELSTIDKAEDPNGWLAVKIELDNAKKVQAEAAEESLDATRKSNSASNDLKTANSSYEDSVVYAQEALDDIPELSKATGIEHYWDNAFGFFGLLRDHDRYLDSELINAYDVDSSGDGVIQYSSELVHPYARLAARIDSTASLGNLDISQTLVDAFIQGRQIITGNHGKAVVVDQGYQAEVAVHADTIAESWDKLIAANTIHYINKTLEALQGAGPLTDLEGEYYENWSRLKGVALSLQFSPYMAISVEGLESVHENIGTEPILLTSDIAQHISDLQAARAQLQTSYDFAETNVLNW